MSTWVPRQDEVGIWSVEPARKESDMSANRFSRVVALVVGIVLLTASCTRDGGGDGDENGDRAQGETAQQPTTESLLQTITERGILRCGVNNTVPGFGFETAEGQIEGFDIDFCRAISAALFGTDSPEEGTHYELIPIDADARFNALRAGEFDVLIRNTTWTSSRDGAEGVSFAHPNFYDGQAMLVPAENFASIEDLDGANICVTTGTTTELNLADYFAARDITFEPVVLEDYEVIFESFRQERCDAVTGDRSALAGLLPLWEEDVPNLAILEDVISKEPLAPGVLDGDAAWFDVVNMVVNGIILAEELGVSSANVDQEIESPSDPFIGALLGVPVAEGEELGLGFDPGIGVEPTFMQNVLRAVGNYADIFDRHLAPLGHERGINALWTDGGIQYAIPFR
jgi:general L-amino acid transport system substrate-binding protein